MAIIIPSKKIYDKQNPKVIENALKQIEVTQNVVSLINEKNKENLRELLENGTDQEVVSTTSSNRIKPSTGTSYMFGAGLRTDITRCKNTINEIARFRKGYYIEEISPTLEVEFDVTISTVNAVSYLGIIPEGYKRFDFFEGDKETIYNSRARVAYDYVFETSDISYNYADNYKLESVLTISPNGISSYYSVTDNNRVTNESEGENLNSNLVSKILLAKDISPYEIKVSDTDEEFSVEVDWVKKITVWIAQDYASSTLEGNKFSRPIEAIKVEMEAKKAEIVYNETAKYIDTNDENIVLTTPQPIGEAVFSINKNDFVRKFLKYNKVEGDSSLLYSKTLNLYKKGKENAVIRCSIGEYSDENGNVVISTKTSNKMLFEHYDKVVPMVRRTLSQEEPISSTEDDLAKVFEVVGVRVFFDGAVWQELTLRETDKSIDLRRTTYETIVNKANGLTYKITSNEIKTDENSANGRTYTIGE